MSTAVSYFYHVHSRTQAHMLYAYILTQFAILYSLPLCIIVLSIYNINEELLTYDI